MIPNLFDSPHILPAPEPMPKRPDFSIEHLVDPSGLNMICGVDEAGRGPLAGPVVASAVILDPDNLPEGLNDSKKLTERKREFLFDEIMKKATVATASLSAASIDNLNIRAASLQAMRLAIAGLPTSPDHALIDGNALPPGLICPATAIIKGDARSLSVAAASIIAKVTRDRMMARAASHYPGYGLAGHKGYPTVSHRDVLAEIGPSLLHRQSFAPVKASLRNEAKNGPSATKNPT